MPKNKGTKESAEALRRATSTRQWRSTPSSTSSSTLRPSGECTGLIAVTLLYVLTEGLTPCRAMFMALSTEDGKPHPLDAVNTLLFTDWERRTTQRFWGGSRKTTGAGASASSSSGARRLRFLLPWQPATALA